MTISTVPALAWGAAAPVDAMEMNRLGDALKSAVDLSMQYYTGLLQLSTNYIQSLGTLMATNSIITSASSPAAAVPASIRPPLLLAASAGQEAVASFLVENTMTARVTARVSVIQSADAAARVSAQPEVVALGPGEQSVIQARVRIDPGMQVGRDHVGEFAIPELASRTIPFVVRRLPDPPPEARNE